MRNPVSMTRRIPAAALAVALTVGTVAAAPAAAASPSKDYLGFIRQNIPASRYVPNATVLGLGKSICRALDVGIKPNTIGMTLMGNGITPHDAAYFVVGAASLLCPVHQVDL